MNPTKKRPAKRRPAKYGPSFAERNPILSKLLDLKYGETQTPIPLDRPRKENQLNFNPITNINNRNEQIENKAEKED